MPVPLLPALDYIGTGRQSVRTQAKLLICSLVWCWLLVGTAITAQNGPQVTKPDYSQESFVIEELTSRVSFETGGTGTRETRARVRMQSENGVRQFGLLVFSFFGSTEQLEVEVRVRKPDGTIVVTPPENIQELPAEISRTAPSYSDLREKHIVVKSLGLGDILEYQVRTSSQSPLIPGQFWFTYNFFHEGICLKEELEVSVPKDREVKVKSEQVQPAVREEGNRRIYAWKTASLERKPNKPKKGDKVAREALRPAVQLSSFRSWEEVGRWYFALQDERVKPTPEVAAKAAELVRGAASDAEKLRAIYHYVATQFRYIAISFGVGRFQPHAAAEVLGNQYGDCKDKHTLLASLLQAAGLPSYPALVHSTTDVDSEVPSPAQFDHLISVVPQGKAMVWLDTTTEVAPFGFLLSGLRDKQALVMMPGKPAQLMKTPAEPPFPSFQKFEVEGKLSSEGILEAKVRSTTRGDAEILLRSAYQQTPRPQWQELTQRISYLLGFGGTVSSVTATAPEDTERPFELAYEYNRKDYSDWEHQQIGSPLPPLGLPAAGDEDSKEPLEKIELGAPQELDYAARVTLPSGSNPHLPVGLEVKRDFAEYHSEYIFANGVFRARRHLIIKYRELPATRTEEYRGFRRLVNEDESKLVRLKGPPSLEFSGSANSEATQLLAEALQASQVGNLRRAQGLLERATELDPTFSRAWSTLGIVYVTTGDVPQGLKALRKAIEVNPHEPSAYKALGMMLRTMGRNEEAAQVWRDLHKEFPEDQDAASNLALTLIDLKRYSEAAEAMEAALDVNQETYGMQLQLGTAYIRAGNLKKALAAFERAAALDSSPNTLNAISYELAEANTHLPEAQEYAENGVAALEGELHFVTLDTLETEDLQRVSELGAIWDTLGWVYFRTGDFQKSELYLRASWSLIQAAEAADHLGQLYEKQQKTQAAAHAYAWALGTGHLMPEVNERLTRLLGSRLRADAAVQKARSDTSLMRTTRVPRPAPGRASAEFFVLLSPGPKVDDVQFIHGDESLRSASGAIASAKFDAVFPSQKPTRIVRRGILSCPERATPTCDFVLLPPDSVRSVE